MNCKRCGKWIEPEEETYDDVQWVTYHCPCGYKKGEIQS